MNLEVLEKYYKEGWLIKQTHPTLPLTIWNYSQSTQFEQYWDEITLQCRGLVTENETGKVVARPYHKFFNMEELKHTATNEFDVFEKMDGSLIIVFYYKNSWVVASRASFTSEQSVAATKLFCYEYTKKNFNFDVTYLFELIAPWNRIVVDYGNEEKIVLLGGIVTATGEEVSYEDLSALTQLNNIEIVKRYDGLKDIKTLKGMVANNAEGFVVRFSNGDRMKVKGEEYLRLHRVLTNFSSYNIWETMRTGKSVADCLDTVPDEFFDWVKKVESAILCNFSELKNYYYELYKRYEHIESQKEFAEEVLKLREYGLNAGILFKIRQERNFDEIIWKMCKPEYELPFKQKD